MGMNAQKLKNNKIVLSSKAPRKDAIEVIEDLRVSDFYAIMKAARNWSENLDDRRDIVFTTYENESSKVCKEFDRIVKRRAVFEQKLTEIKEEEYTTKDDDLKVVEEIPPQAITDNNKVKSISYNSEVKGTSRLLRIPKKQTIKIVRRKGLIDDNNRPNSVCIDNKLREEFFHDVKSTKRFSDNGLYEILHTEEDKQYYEKWDSIMQSIYEEGLDKCLNVMNSVKK